MDWKTSNSRTHLVEPSSCLPYKRGICSLSVSLNLWTIESISPKVEFTIKGMHFYIDISGKFNHVQRDPEDRGHRVVEVTTKLLFRNVIDEFRPLQEFVSMSRGHRNLELRCR